MGAKPAGRRRPKLRNRHKCYTRSVGQWDEDVGEPGGVSPRILRRKRCLMNQQTEDFTTETRRARRPDLRFLRVLRVSVVNLIP